MESLFHYSSLSANGFEQMAWDESFLHQTSTDGAARFRFYYWTAPTISLGYFQDYFRFVEQFPEMKKLDMVRRLTGGGAILHDQEITYMLVIPNGTELYDLGPMAGYILVHEAIADALRPLGIHVGLRPKQISYTQVRDEPEFCFARPCPTDLICSKGKLVGSAQRRLPNAFLQHGSIILEKRFTEHPTTSIAELLNETPTKQELESLIVSELSQRMELKFTPKEFSCQDIEVMNPLVSKYSGEDWTIHRKA
jgi:lipoate-protein ligase A